jgi:hypothetical protein
MPAARLHDQSTIDVEVHGDGPAVLLPVNPRPVEGPQAEEMRRWGADPALGRALIDGSATCSGMLQVTTATHEMAMANAVSPPAREPSGEPPDEPDWSQVGCR